MFHIEPNSPQHIKVGILGEDIACKYLKQKGYKIIERNFRRKWGEIDVICLKKTGVGSIWNKMTTNILNVLQRTNDSKYSFDIGYSNVPQETNDKVIFVEVKTLREGSGLNPEDNLTESKKKKLIRTCELYISDNPKYKNLDWQIDAVLITLSSVSKKAKIVHIESAIY